MQGCRKHTTYYFGNHFNGAGNIFHAYTNNSDWMRY
jgi:hypothetical protein